MKEEIDLFKRIDRKFAKQILLMKKYCYKKMK